MKDITPETRIKFTLKQLLCIASFLVIGAIGYSDLRYEVRENRKETQALVVQFDLYALKRQVLASEMFLAREFNRTNKVDERDLESRLQMILDTK